MKDENGIHREADPMETTNKKRTDDDRESDLETTEGRAAATFYEFDELGESETTEVDDENGSTGCGVNERLNILTETISELVDEALTTKEDISHIHEEITRLRTDDTVLTEMHERNRVLAENAHEREVLYPVFSTLIGIADRCQQQIDKAEKSMEHHRFLLESRNADTIEIESLLANFGVERFVSVEEQFDSTVQKCIERIETNDLQLCGQVAHRLLPGYKRNGKVIRPECVSVFVKTRSKSQS